MKSQLRRLIILGQACFYSGILVAIALKPQGLGTNNGISYYGIFAVTFIPYAIGLIGGAVFCYRSALHITDHALRPIRYALFAIAFFTVIVGVTPYSFDRFTSTAHRLAGTILFTVQFLLSLWLTAKLHYIRQGVMLMIIEFVAGIACAYYVNFSYGFLIQFQVLFQFAFGTLLLYSLAHLQPGFTDSKKMPDAKERAG